MFPIPDALAAFYLICFAVGFLFVFASLFLGITQDTLHLPGLPHGDGGTGDLGGADAGATGDVGLPAGGEVPSASASDGAGGHGSGYHGGAGVSPVNVSTVMAFLTWFGGAGYLLRAYAGLAGVASVV
ncbi:MAG: hypothetical protein ACYC66_18275, partial [Chloroflexota bacterium]